MSKYLVEQLREDHELLKDGYQDNLTRAWHDVAMKNTAMDCSEGADEIERLNGIIDAALSLCEDVYGAGYIMIALSKAHKVKE